MLATYYNYNLNIYSSVCGNCQIRVRRSSVLQASNVTWTTSDTRCVGVVLPSTGALTCRTPRSVPATGPLTLTTVSWRLQLVANRLPLKSCGKAAVILVSSIVYPHRLCRSAWVGRSRLSVCPQHNSKTNDPQVFKLGIEDKLAIGLYPRSDKVLGLRSRV